MSDPTKFHFELTQDQVQDIYASLMLSSKEMIEQKNAPPRQIAMALKLVKFAEEWHQMFHAQFVGNVPATETKQ